MTRVRRCTLALGVIILVSAVVPRLWAQAPAQQSPVRRGDTGWLWIEQFEGSSNTDGQVMALTSSGGYNFNSHLGVVAGLPIYFVHVSSSTTGGSSADGIGDIFGSLRLSFANPLVNYRTALTGTAPSGDSSKGLSTGHATYDWSNRFDRGFGPWTPFFSVGLANSIPNTFLFQRQFTSLGHLAHFEAGTTFSIFGPLSITPPCTTSRRGGRNKCSAGWLQREAQRWERAATGARSR